LRNGEILNLGLIPYQEGRDIQLKAFDRVKSGKTDGILLLLQHPPVYTVGVSGEIETDSLIPLEELSKRAELYKVERGGKTTFHGPGQIVAYPIFNLTKWQKDVHLFVNNLEETIIRLLHDYGIKAGRKPQYTGVWVKDEKICAIGIAVKKWITWHGIALNVNTDLSYFDLINACGIKEFGVVTMEQLGIKEDIEKVKNKMIEKFSEVFDIKFNKINLSDLAVESDA